MDIYTIGHSVRSINQFIKILIENGIKCVVDVRSYPYSSTVPQFNIDVLKESLAKYKIRYVHIKELGGRRKLKSELDTSIKSKGFASYAQHMRTDEFEKGLEKLKKIAAKKKTVILCAESLVWKCHRRLISDRLKFDHWKVYHLGLGKKPVKHKIWEIARWSKKYGVVYDK